MSRFPFFTNKMIEYRCTQLVIVAPHAKLMNNTAVWMITLIFWWWNRLSNTVS